MGRPYIRSPEAEEQVCVGDRRDEGNRESGVWANYPEVLPHRGGAYI